MTEVISTGWPGMSGVGETVLFWIVAAVMIAAALGVLFFKKAAYAALCMVVVMVSMAVLFFALQAPFNGAVQIIVYTGAIMMLFLFVIMMIGLGASDDYTRQRKGYIIAAAVMGVLLAVMGVATVFTGFVSGPGFAGQDQYSNEPIWSLAATLFSEHWLSIELAGVLLVIAAVGAVLLTHQDRLGVRLSQRQAAKARMQAYGAQGIHVGQAPAPGVYAKSNAVDNAAIAGDTLQPVMESLPRVLRVRGLDQPMHSLDAEVARSLQLARAGKREETIWGGDKDVAQSGSWGMPGQAAPSGLQQTRAPHAEETNSKEAQQ